MPGNSSTCEATQITGINTTGKQTEAEISLHTELGKPMHLRGLADQVSYIIQNYQIQMTGIAGWGMSNQG